MYQKILVALDRSASHRAVLDRAMALAQGLKAQLMLLHVLSAYDADSPGLPVRAYHSYYPILDSVAWDTYQQRWSHYEEAGLEELRRGAAIAQELGIAVEYTQTAGDPGRVICDLAKGWQADLILVGHRGRHGISEFLLGSVSNYVMHNAPCSVLVVRQPGEPEAAETEAKAGAIAG